MLTSFPSASPRKARRLLRPRAARLFPAALLLFFVAPAAAPTFAQTAAQREAPATVTGRVTDGEKGLAGVAVVLVPADAPTRLQAVARAKTDAEGNYRMTGVAPGHYKVLPFSPTYVVEGMNVYEYPPGKSLNLAAGESVEGIDFRLERGGVITGRVTDADGQPVIAESVSVVPVRNMSDPQQQTQVLRGPFDVRDYSTDDRGVYRIYGLLPGTYHVSVGQGGDNTGALSYGRRKLYRRTFYPDATDEAQASAVEVTAGGESSGVDITLGGAMKTFRASGRFVSAETGQPVAGIRYSYAPLRADGHLAGGYGGLFSTNERGEFQTEGLAPGHYAVFASNFGAPQSADNALYSDPVTFDVVDSDVNGIVVRLRAGASVSGVVAVEGVADPGVAARLLSGVGLYGVPQPTSQTIVPNISRSLAPGPDGTFRLAGLQPGKLRIFVNGNPKGLTLSRVELNGANVTNTGLDIAEGAQVTGVRVVIAYGTGVIRGQVNFLNGSVPASARVYIYARRAGAEDSNGGWAEADARGRFVMQNLPAGDYEVHARVMIFQPGQRPAMSEQQHVSLGEGGDTTVTLTVDFGAPPGGVKP
jgi:protocatechuate 3,4-dioxygenase beta subunit